MTTKFQLDPEINVLYLSLERGVVARTIESSESVHVDIDVRGGILGVEFVNADELLPFLRDARLLAIESGADDIPEPTLGQLRALFSITSA